MEDNTLTVEQQYKERYLKDFVGYTPPHQIVKVGSTFLLICWCDEDGEYLLTSFKDGDFPGHLMAAGSLADVEKAFGYEFINLLDRQKIEAICKQLKA